jgi:glycerophosphoryl diester phosphodiesterase
VIPWTVNDADTMRKLLTWGVDGLITDYPDLAVKVLSE